MMTLLFALSLMFFIALEELPSDQHPLQYRALPVFHWIQDLQMKPFQAVTPYRKIPLKCYPTKASITFLQTLHFIQFREQQLSQGSQLCAGTICLEVNRAINPATDCYAN